jgi:hypothetical protein
LINYFFKYILKVTFLTDHICFTKVGKALQAKSFNYRILALNARLYFSIQNQYFLGGKNMCWKKRKKKAVRHTETVKIRSTPLSGLLWQTSRMEAAKLIQIALSDMKSVKLLGSRTP